MGKKDGDEFSAEEIARRRDELAKQMLNTPPKPLKPHSAMKVGKRKAKASRTKKRAQTKKQS